MDTIYGALKRYAAGTQPVTRAALVAHTGLSADDLVRWSRNTLGTGAVTQWVWDQRIQAVLPEVQAKGIREVCRAQGWPVIPATAAFDRISGQAAQEARCRAALAALPKPISLHAAAKACGVPRLRMQLLLDKFALTIDIKK